MGLRIDDNSNAGNRAKYNIMESASSKNGVMLENKYREFHHGRQKGG